MGWNVCGTIPLQLLQTVVEIVTGCDAPSAAWPPGPFLIGHREPQVAAAPPNPRISIGIKGILKLKSAMGIGYGLVIGETMAIVHIFRLCE